MPWRNLEQLHLATHGVELSTVHWQTDDGAEFLDQPPLRGFPSLIRRLGIEHHFIPPKAYTWQSDVETVHRLVEDEFFDRELFASPAQFWSKLTTYWLHFNIARPNSGKEFQTPMHIILSKAASLNPAIAAWRPLDLGRLHAHYDRPSTTRGGDDLPPQPLSTLGLSIDHARSPDSSDSVVQAGSAAAYIYRTR